MDSYIKYHLAISKENYVDLRNSYLTDSKGIEIKEYPPNYESFWLLIERVGGPWGWTRRPRYYNNKAELKHVLANQKSHLFVFSKGGLPMGYSLIAPVKEDVHALLPETAPESIIEIENFGLFPEHTGKGYGQYILPQIFSRLFEMYDVIYLSSRSTNHKKVIPFYVGLGMKIIGKEELPDDLVPEETVYQIARRV